MTNQTRKRIRVARQALTHYLSQKGVEPDTIKTDIIDLVTDLFHLADAHGVDYASVVFCAREHFLAETEHPKISPV